MQKVNNRQIKPMDEPARELADRMARLEAEYAAVANARPPEQDTGGATYVVSQPRNTGHPIIPDDDGGPAFCNGVRILEDQR